MILKSLEIRGFKSFPDKTILNFDKGITAVVGPNGSGKSNLSDAIRWVLGEQSNKALRGSKMEDVIFNGTSSRTALGYAEVSLTIDNCDRKLEFDADEVRVTRRYYRSGESEYMLNNATVRLKDVQMLFMDTGLGRDGYSVIGQGRITDIVSSRSDDRREIFEEAAGISKYRYRKNEAERKLQNTEENLVRLRDILGELEERVGPLETQSKKAEKFLSLAGEKKELEIGLWLHQLNSSRETMRTLSDKLELARTQYDSAEADLVALDQELETIANEAITFAAQIDQLQRSAASFDEQAARLEGDIAVCQNDIEHFEEDIQRLEDEKNQHSSNDQQLLDEIEACKAEIEERNKKIEEANQERLVLSDQLESLSKSSSENTTQLTEQNNLASDIATQLADTRVTQITGENTLNEIAIQLGQLNTSVDQLREQANNASKEKEESEEAFKICKEHVESLQNTVSGYELRFQARQEKAEAAKTESEDARLDAEAARHRLHILEDLERTMEGFAGSTKLVLKQAERGALSGIHGAVSRLIEVPSDLTLAVETALGNAAQNVICDTEQDAKRGIRFLKNENAGRVTFLPLENIQGNLLKEKDVEQEPGVRGIASNLVSYDKKFKNIIENLLGHTVVTDDLDTATVISRKYGYRFRVVTIDGQVVNAGGSLTGGSHVKGAGLLSRRSEIERLENLQKEASAKAKKTEETYLELNQEASAAQAALIGAQGELTTAQEDYIRLESDLRRISDVATASAEALENCLNDIRSLNERAEETKKSIEAAQKETEKLNEKYSAVTAVIEALSGGQDEMLNAREEISNQIADVKLRVLGLEKEIEGIEATIEGIQKRRQGDDDFQKGIDEKIEDLHSRIDEINQKIESIQAEAEQQRANAVSARDTVELLTKKRIENESNTTEIRKKSKDLADAKERLGGEVARLEEKSIHAEDETNTIIRKLYEEYEMTRAEAEEYATIPEDIPEATKRLNELRNKIRALGNVNVGAIEEYKEVKERYDTLSVQVEDVEVSKKGLLDLIEELTTQMSEMFILRFNQINTYFREVFTELFNGGKASLRLENPDDILHSGIDMDIQPPGKVILNLAALSGGEQALTAIALLFAILKVTPSPFCVLDEIDAALDDVNIGRFGAYLRRLTDFTQFIVITHRRGTMEEANVLYGVTMQEKGVTKLLELRASEVEARLGMNLSEGE